VHFIGPDGQTRIGPWLLLDNHYEVRAILRWGNVTVDDLTEHESSIRRWGVSSAVLNLTDQQLAALIERGRGLPWNGLKRHSQDRLTQRIKRANRTTVRLTPQLPSHYCGIFF